MNTTSKIQINSSLSALAKAHQELLSHFENSAPKAGGDAKVADHGTEVRVERASAPRPRRGK
jgi:hypothetical protein